MKNMNLLLGIAAGIYAGYHYAHLKHSLNVESAVMAFQQQRTPVGPPIMPPPPISPVPPIDPDQQGGMINGYNCGCHQQHSPSSFYRKNKTLVA